MKNKPLTSLPLPGMEAVDEERNEALQLATAAELTAEMRKPLGNINATVGEMERTSPLFFGAGHNPTLF